MFAVLAKDKQPVKKCGSKVKGSLTPGSGSFVCAVPLITRQGKLATKIYTSFLLACVIQDFQ